MRLPVVILSGLWLVSAASLLHAAETVTVSGCVLLPDAEVRVPAQEAGVLVRIPVREGQPVAKGDLLAQIDDVIPLAQYNIADFKLKVAEKQAVDNIDVRYANAAFQHASAKLQRSLKANKDNPGTRSDDEIDEQKLEKQKFNLAIEKAQKDLDVAGLQKGVSQAELQAAKANLEHREIRAPLNAVVVELKPHEGDWVAAGDMVMKLVRVDVLRVQGFANIRDCQPSEVQDLPVQVVVTLARGKSVTVPGKIEFVSPVLQLGGNFRVRAEVENRKQGNAWVLNPGMTAEMIIQLK
jgi:multidrug efflux pump subunit AcrA (membrane-fusion protein)